MNYYTYTIRYRGVNNYFCSLGDIHNTIGPTIANRKITPARISHRDAYVYSPCPILSICRKLVKLLSATTGLNVTCTSEVAVSAASIPSRVELAFDQKSNKKFDSGILRLTGKIDSNSKKNSRPIIAPNGKF